MDAYAGIEKRFFGRQHLDTSKVIDRHYFIVIGGKKHSMHIVSPLAWRQQIRTGIQLTGFQDHQQRAMQISVNGSKLQAELLLKAK